MFQVPRGGRNVGTDGRKPFKLFTRETKKGRVYYARYLKPDGSYTAGRSTGETVRRKAEAAAWDTVQAGQIVKAQIVTIEDLLQVETDTDGRRRAMFFDWNGDWAVTKRSAGKRCTPRSCRDHERQALRYVVSLLGKSRLNNIDTVSIRSFRNMLFKRGLAGASINKILTTVKALIDYAEDHHLLRYRPRIERAALNEKTRGVLEKNEVQELFSRDWADHRAKIANLVAACAGLRLSEVLGLRIKDVQNGLIVLTGRWDQFERCRVLGTKNGQKKREIPIPENVQAEIDLLAAENPHGYDPEYYLFFSTEPMRPMERKIITRELYRELENIGIPEAERRERNITFHSHRHFFNSILLEARVPIEKIQRLTGHLSKSMTDRYYHVSDTDDISEVQRSLFRVISA